MKTGKNEFNDIAKKHNIKIKMCGDADSPSSHKVDDPIKFFDEYHYGDDVVKDLKEMTVGEKYNVDEMMQDIEILRYE